MSDKIVTRPFQFGDEKEGSWPSRWPSGETGIFHIDTETGKCVEGPPPLKVNVYGKAPYVISDTMDAYRHPASGRWLDSKSALRQEDKATGCITTDKKLPPDPTIAKQNREELVKDRTRALHKAVADIDNGNAPLSEETKHLCKQENERISNLKGFDAFNVAGRKDNPDGFKYRRK